MNHQRREEGLRGERKRRYMDSPFPSDLESASQLLARLDLIDGNRSKKNMDNMDTDLVLEVPDTPDRMAMMPPVDGSSGPSIRREDVVIEIDTPSSNQRIVPARKLYDHLHRDSSALGDVGSSSTARADAEHLCRQVRLDRLISKTLETKPSPEAEGTVLELEQNRVSNESENSTETIELSQKSPLPLSYPTGHRGQRRKKGKEPCGESEGSESGLLMPSDERKGIVLSCDSHNKIEQTLSRALQLDASRRNMQQRRLVHNDYIGSLSPCNEAKSHISSEVDGHNIINSVDVEIHPSFVEISDQDNMKGIDSYKQLQFVALPRNTGPRRLVHNGCTSPNMVQGKNVAKDDVGKMVLSKLLDGVSSHQIHSVTPDFEGGHGDNKGKVILDDNAVSDMQHIKAKPQSGRVCLVPGKEVTVIADDDDALRSSQDIGWRTTYDFTKKTSAYSLRDSASKCAKKDSASNSKREENTSSDRSHEIATGDRDYVNLVHDSPEITTSSHRSNLSAVRASSVTESESRRCQRRKKHNKGKRKGNSVYSNYGECSSSTLEDSEISYLRSSGQISNSKLNRTYDSHHHGIILGPVTEDDELHSPEATYSILPEQSCRVSDDSTARARQVESDELLARQLQEQFYHELQGLGGTEEINATLPWSLQQEDARHASSIARRGQSNPRDTTIAHLYTHYPRLPFQNSSARLTNSDRVPISSRMTQSRRNFMDLETTLMAEVRRNFNSAEMDLEMRENILEALEAAFDISNDMFADNVLQIHRDFNENDYEMLLALDENNHQHHGASESQINSLPQSVVQSDNIEEACAVCLETPSVGDIIRHLPCLHKFHKDCIDTWLGMRTSCPVCKSNIT